MIITDIFSDVVGATRTVVDGGAHITLGIIAVIALISAFRMEHIGQVFGRTMTGVVLVGLLGVVAQGLMSDGRLTAEEWLSQINAAWKGVMTLQGSTLVGYIVAFFVAICAGYIIRLFVGMIRR